MNESKFEFIQNIFDEANESFALKEYSKYVNKIIDIYNKIDCNCFFNMQEDSIFQDQLNFIRTKHFIAKKWENYFIKGFIFLMNEKQNLAYENLTIALEIKRHPLLYSLRSTLNFDNNQGNLRDSEIAIQLDPSARNFFNRAKLFSKIRNNERSNKNLEYLNKAIELKPDFSCAYNNRAIQHLKNNDIDKALLDYKSCIFYQPNHWASESLIVYLCKLGKISEALFYTDHAIENSKEKEKYILKKTEILIDLKEFSEAINHLNFYIKTFPDNFKIQYELEQVNAKRIKYYLKKAQDYFLKNKFKKASVYYEIINSNKEYLSKTDIQNYLISLLKINIPSFDFDGGIHEFKTKNPDLVTREYDQLSYLNYGKYKGKQICEVELINPNYILWCVINLKHFTISNWSFLKPKIRKNILFYSALEKNIIKQEFTEKISTLQSNYYKYDNYQDESVMNSEYYNDNLDMDQQSPEFWDSL
tara:strand:+ start:187 stop:1608 length:1422 start_codon:yes stop_codon:yes gene_type:complete